MEMYKHWESDEIGEERKRAKEANDCTVMTWANCFDSTYEQARQWLSRHGRRHRKGMYEKDIRKALEACVRAKVRVGPYARNNKISLKKFIEKHDKGRYFVCVRGHALCVKDGVVYDYYPGLRRQVTFAARVYLEGEI